jgi:beta-N-acetylhexosaminidase
MWRRRVRPVGAGAAVGGLVLVVAGCTGVPAAPPGRGSAGSASHLSLAASPTCTTAQVVAGWTVRRQARQTIVVPVQETHVAAVGAEVAAGVGGVILFGSEAPTDLGARLDALTAQALGGIAPFVMTDEEGGAVQRMANLVGSMPSARTMAATMTPTQVRQLAHRVGTRMHDAGVTVDLAPVLDLDAGVGPNANDPDGTRSFSLQSTTATRYGLAFARGLLDAGVVPVVKHFPGLGQATANTDVAAAWTQPWSVLQQHGLLPFTAAVNAGMPAVMTTNARVPGLAPLPASLSWRATHRVLRRQLAFHGLVLTDSLSAVAVRAAGYHIPRASVRAIVVGADMVLFNAPADQVADVTHRVVRAIVNAVDSGTLTRTRLRGAVVHVLRAKRVSLCPH